MTGARARGTASGWARGRGEPASGLAVAACAGAGTILNGQGSPRPRQCGRGSWRRKRRRQKVPKIAKHGRFSTKRPRPQQQRMEWRNLMQLKMEWLVDAGHAAEARRRRSLSLWPGAAGVAAAAPPPPPPAARPPPPAPPPPPHAQARAEAVHPVHRPRIGAA